MRLAPFLAVALLTGCPSAPVELPQPRPTPAPPPLASVPPSAPPHEPQADAPKAAGLTMTLDGAPIEVKSVLAIDEGDGVVEVEVTNYPLSCEEKLSGYRNPPEGDVSLRLRLRRMLLTDGRRVWAIHGKYMGGTTTESQGAGDPVPSAVVDGAAGATGRIGLDFDWEMLGLDGKPERRLVAKGSTEVLGCGRPEGVTDRPLPAAQPGAFIEIAGLEVPIVGAGILVGDTFTKVVVSADVVKCMEGASWMNDGRPSVSIEMNWDAHGKLYNAIRDGDLIGWGARQQQQVALTADPIAPKSGQKMLEITLGGSTVIDEYPVKLTGKVNAVVCREPEKKKR